MAKSPATPVGINAYVFKTVLVNHSSDMNMNECVLE